MADQNDGTGRAFFTGALIGGLIGAIIAVWRAPRSGQATRALIQGRGRKLVDEVEQAADQVRRKIEGDPLTESLEEGKAEARRLNAGASALPAPDKAKLPQRVRD